MMWKSQQKCYETRVKVIVLGIHEAVTQQLSLMATQAFSYYFPKEGDLPMFSKNVFNIIAEFQMDSIKEVEGKKINNVGDDI